MPHRCTNWLTRIKDVEREHAVTRLSTDRLLADAEHDPTVLTGDLRPRDVRKASERLDGTYVIRLFAEFESGLRCFWPTARGGDAPGRTRDLLDGVAATRQVPHDDLDNAHAVREYRNHLIHEREAPLPEISIPDARRRLCLFFRFLPPEW